MKHWVVIGVLALASCGGQELGEVTAGLMVKGKSYRYVGQTSDAAAVRRGLRADGRARITVIQAGAAYESDGDLGPQLVAPLLPGPVLFSSPGFDHTGVIGNDERTVVSDSQVLTYPYLPNITVNWVNAASSVLCSATFVSPHDALTAAHCVFDAAGGGGGGTGFRSFNFAAMGSNVQQHFPTASCIALIGIPSAYLNQNNIGDFLDDYATLNFQGCGDNLAQYTGHLSLGLSANIGTSYVFADGYPQFCGCSGGLTLTGMCQSVSTQRPGTPAMQRQTFFGVVFPLWTTTNLDMTEQESGMGVYFISGGGFKVIGTGVGNSSGLNWFRDFDQSYLNLLAANSDDF